MSLNMAMLMNFRKGERMSKKTKFSSEEVAIIRQCVNDGTRHLVKKNCLLSESERLATSLYWKLVGIKTLEGK